MRLYMENVINGGVVMPLQWKELMGSVTEAYRDILGDNLTGIYVHGSAAFGCWNPVKSDVDFIAVTEKPPVREEKEAMIRILLSLTPFAPVKGFEMSAVLRTVCGDFIMPTPYELHFSNTWMAEAQKNLSVYCEKMHGTDPDLAAHFTVIRHTGIPVYGPPVPEVFGMVPEKAYLESIRMDVDHAEEQIEVNPVYIILNLCRVLAWMEEKKILSKRDGGLWGMHHLPQKFRPLAEAALEAYSSTVFDSAKILLESTQIKSEFCKYMSKRIFCQ